VAVLTLTDFDRPAKRCPVEWNMRSAALGGGFTAECHDGERAEIGDPKRAFFA